VFVAAIAVPASIALRGEGQPAKPVIAAVSDGTARGTQEKHGQPMHQALRAVADWWVEVAHPACSPYRSPIGGAYRQALARPSGALANQPPQSRKIRHV
jgi:hypothetical protein